MHPQMWWLVSIFGLFAFLSQYRAMTLIHVAAATFMALFPITNPIGSAAVYAGLSANLPVAEQKKQAIKTGIYVCIILVSFAVLGSALLKALGLSIPAMQIAGGIIVGQAGFGMINFKEKLSKREGDHAQHLQDISFSPMALPLIAGPGAIGVVIALAAQQKSFDGTIGIVIGCVAISVLIGALLRFSAPMIERMGPTGVGALTRIMGFLILAIGVQLIISGWTSLHH